MTYNSRVGRSVTPAEGLEEVSLNRKIPVETSFWGKQQKPGYTG